MTRQFDLQPVVSWLQDSDPLAMPEVEEKARFVLLDTLGCFIASMAHAEPRALARDLCLLEPGKVTLPGVADGGLAAGAAGFLIALGACWDEACEGLARAHGRPGLHAVPAAVALGLSQQGNLATTLRAIITGYEVGARVGEKFRIKAGMHVDGAWGSLAAAAAAARSLTDDVVAIMTAIDIAACQVPFSLYLPVSEGSAARNTYCGHGVTLGMQAALAARAGIGAPENALTSYNEIALGGGEVEPPTGIGEYLILEGYLKKFAAVRHVHYGIQGALDWRATEGQGTADISAIRLSIYQEAVTYCSNRMPVTPIQGQFSLSYGIACALVTGAVGPGAYEPEVMANPEIRRLEQLVTLAVDQSRTAEGRRGATVAITKAGSAREIDVKSVAGDPGRAFGSTDVTSKFETYAVPIIGRQKADAIAAAILSGPGEVPLATIFGK
jgi:2-methylcitrate dehydratase PrpD